MTISTPKTNKVTRYRVTLDFTVDTTNCVGPKEWNWHELLELENGEKVNELHVENLGDYKTKKKRK
jgi:hypothetical protein